MVAESPNLVQQTNDPTAHAEILAVGQARQRLGSPSLWQATRSTSSPTRVPDVPRRALYYASPDRVVFVVTREGEGRFYRDDGRYFGFENFYDEYPKPRQKRRLPMDHRASERGGRGGLPALAGVQHVRSAPDGVAPFSCHGRERVPGAPRAKRTISPGSCDEPDFVNVRPSRAGPERRDGSRSRPRRTYPQRVCDVSALGLLRRLRGLLLQAWGHPSYLIDRPLVRLAVLLE